MSAATTSRATRLPVGVLVSGTGTNLQALLDSVHGREAEVAAVASSSAAAPALARARAREVPVRAFERAAYGDRGERDRALGDWLEERGVKLVVLAGYMELLGERFLARFPGAVINVHPSLLPAFPGLRAIEQALSYGVKVFGVTVHFVDAGVDSGPVILQRAVELPNAHDPGDVLAALRPLEHALLPEAVRLFAAGALRVDAARPRHVVVDRLPQRATTGSAPASAPGSVPASAPGSAPASPPGSVPASAGASAPDTARAAVTAAATALAAGRLLAG